MNQYTFCSLIPFPILPHSDLPPPRGTSFTPTQSLYNTGQMFTGSSVVGYQPHNVGQHQGVCVCVCACVRACVCVCVRVCVCVYVRACVRFNIDACCCLMSYCLLCVHIIVIVTISLDVYVDLNFNTV